MKWALAIAFGLMAGQAAACIVTPGPDPLLGANTLPVEKAGTVWYAGRTEAYPHAVLGDAIEAEAILLWSPRAGGSCKIMIAEAGPAHVFEDTAPRLADMNGDGIHEIIAVRSSLTQGAQLVVYREAEDVEDDVMQILASTPYIGQRNRWLAPIGAADLDGDGTMEIAYIDRPHLAKTLRIVSIDGDLLAEEIAGAGFTNHRIGERDIAGGVRDCGNGPEMIVASADWSQLVAVTYDGKALTARQIGTDTSRPAFAKAMACQ